MTTPKFKIGDRVKWKDGEGRARSGVIVRAAASAFGFYIHESDGLTHGLWHESHLSLDAPEPKKHATDCEVGLGVEIIDLIKKCSSQAKSIEHLSNRLTEEISGRARERIAKESAEADTKRMAEGNKWLIDALSAEARAKEAAQRELAKANDSLHFQRMELRKAMEDRSVEWLANEAAKKELADVRRDLADIRIISKRLAL